MLEPFRCYNALVTNPEESEETPDPRLGVINVSSDNPAAFTAVVRHLVSGIEMTRAVSSAGSATLTLKLTPPDPSCYTRLGLSAGIYSGMFWGCEIALFDGELDGSENLVPVGKTLPVLPARSEFVASDNINLFDSGPRPNDWPPPPKKIGTP